ncbi:sigma-54-dependent transcriptional regulator [Haliscomenobacter hydrossis]|uniref:Two component, sigma54 specific, transcriptional regulator n=1 Tax=Haliscomenobacter hydrossis (strain ATCC 27775 / DSM 1100 / LMG 10767 / O) TaxID=760192 RepID=F4L616_HALH1|nr:sigma-54 dependent transcriptional regulator [Haliscomenobacter hydrossis]AEE53076.1 putative two component, sigma54 specific, transcriptional regulator [Haliscomenobacter hydrossis DSM 1100]
MAKSNTRLLIIDDELGFYLSFRSFHQANYAFETTSDVERGLKLIETFQPDAVLLDLAHPKHYSYEEGLKTLLPKAIKIAKEKCPIIVVTHSQEQNLYQKAIERGAKACLLKAKYDVEKWHQKIVQVITEFQNNAHTKANPQTKSSPRSSPQDGFLALNPSMQAIKSRLRTLGEKYSHVPVLILGETGVGKEVAARYLHQAKTNAIKLPFETINLSAYAEELLFSEVFGHKKGSFTHAFADQVGAFEKARKGTLFLDEIGEVSLKTQVSLLNVLNDKKFRAVGSTQDIDLDVHLIFATNRDLEEAIAQGNFREDFYHRISDYAIHIPPLRERVEEIQPLMDYFLATLCTDSTHVLYQKNSTEAFTPGAREAFQRFYWPGNIRELRKTIQNLIIEVDVWGKDRIDESILPQRLLQPRVFAVPTAVDSSLHQSPNRPKPSALVPSMNGIQWSIAKQTAFNELSQIEQTLLHSGGRKDDAARSIGLKNDQNLRYKVRKYYKDYPDIFDNFSMICKVYKLSI